MNERCLNRVTLVLSKFEELGSGMQVLKFFAKSKLTPPRKQTSGLKAGQIRPLEQLKTIVLQWIEIEAGNVLNAMASNIQLQNILHNHG